METPSAAGTVTPVIWVLLFPYLPLREPASVDGWALTPVAKLDEQAQVVDGGAAAVSGLLRLYGIDRGAPAAGALARRSDGRVGDEFDATAIQPLSRAVTAAMLDMNPSPLTPEDEQTGNKGHAATTSDNGVAWGHRIGDDGYVAVEYGAMVRTLSGGHNVYNPNSSPFRAPSDLPRPLFARDFDDEYATALHRKITDGTDEGRRLRRTLDWLDLAWRNTASMNSDVRIFAIRAGFEVLFDSDKTYEVRDRLSELLDDPRTPKVNREWLNLKTGKRQSAEMTDLAWWFQNFAFLRNAIAHGNDIAPEDYGWDGVSHLFLGEFRLRQAVRELVIRDGNQDLRLEPHQRTVLRYLREHAGNSGAE
jgi:hypothetical protein